MTDPIKRGPGRPPKLRDCPGCNEPRMARDFNGARLCRECRSKDVPDRAFIPPARRHEVPNAHRFEELVQDATGQSTMKDIIARVCAGFARCGCCLTAEHIRYVFGRPFCALCAVTVETCGRCCEHKSVVFFPDLIGGPEPYVPPDVRALFDAPDVLRRLKSADPVNASPEP